MANEEVSSTRRNLLIATGVVGAIGVAGASVPFISSFQPSARAKTAGAPVDVDISKIDNEPGMRMIVQWRGKPVWIFKRTQEQLAALPSLDGKLRDPKSDNIDQTPAFAKNQPYHRARKFAGYRWFAPIWVASPRHSCLKCCRRHLIRNGKAASIALATNPVSIWQAVCTRVSRRLPILKYRRTILLTRTRLSLAYLHRERLNEQNRQGNCRPDGLV